MKAPTWIFNQKCEIRSRGTNGRGEKFDKLVQSGVPCRIEPSTSQVRRPDGSVTVRRAKAMFPLSTDIKIGNTIICDGIDYEVIDIQDIPSFIGYSHKEGSLG